MAQWLIANWRRVARVAAIVLAVLQLVGFTLFILEESLQTIMFATWQAPANQRAPMAQAYRGILDTSWRILYGLGWSNPLAFLAYRAYFQSAEVWYAAAYLP
jgi:hypothetical protein